MKKKLLTLLTISAIGLSTLVSGCATINTYDAADDIRKLAIALQGRDENAIARYIDKRALRAETANIARDIVIDKSRNALGGGIGAQIAAVTAADTFKPVINVLADRAVQPDVLAYMASRAGLNQNTEIPSRFKASLALHDIGNNSVCVNDDVTKQCALYFGRYSDGWKLNGFNQQLLKERMLQLK